MKKECLLFVAISLILLLETIIISFRYPYEDSYQIGIRLTALIGFFSLFISVIMSDFFEEFREDGEKNLTLHHFFGLLGIILITLHPVILAVYKSDISVFLPKFNSWNVFWELAGRPSLIILYIGFIGGFLLKTYKKFWRVLHMLVYISLFFGLIHGYLIGTDFQNPFITALFIIMFLISIFILINKRLKAKDVK
jgi:predicted ferric reductase